MIFTLILGSIFFLYDMTLPQDEKYYGYITSCVIQCGIIFNMPVIIIGGTIIKSSLSYDIITFINKQRVKFQSN